jgi:hypothetical protein
MIRIEKNIVYEKRRILRFFFLSTLCIAIVSLISCFFVAKSMRLDVAEPTARMRIHAIPMALSQIHHGSERNYTASWPIAMRFQAGNAPTQELIDWAVNVPPISHQRIYLWLADDRGLSDFAYIAFKLFGSNTIALFNLWFLIFFSSCAIFLLNYRKYPLIIVAGTILISSISASIHLFTKHAELISVNYASNIGSINVSESTMFEFIAAIAALHICASLLSERDRLSATTIGCIALQSILLGFLVHARSSLLWLVLAIAMVGFACAARMMFRGAGVFRILLRLAPLLFLFGAILGFRAYERSVAHPGYAEGIGSRTVWHNMLMGMAYSPYFSRSMNLPDLSDADVVEFVLRDMTARGDPRLDQTWTKRRILDSLGSHNLFDWETYDRVARGIFWRTVFESPREALKLYFWHKPRKIIGSLMCQGVVVRTQCLLPGERVEYIATSRNSGSLVVFWFLVCALLSFIYFNFIVKNSALLHEDVTHADITMSIFSTLIFLLLSLAPSLVFYPSVKTLAGSVIIITALVYATFSFLVVRFLMAMRLRGGAELDLDRR